MNNQLNQDISFISQLTKEIENNQEFLTDNQKKNIQKIINTLEKCITYSLGDEPLVYY